MTRTARQRRAAAAAATRRWRRRQAQGVRLVTVEVSESRLARLVAEGLVPASVLEDSGHLSAALGRLIAEGTSFSAQVTDHASGQSREQQGRAARYGITGQAGAGPMQDTVTGHLQEQGRDANGRWVKGTSGNPLGRAPGLFTQRLPPAPSR